MSINVALNCPKCGRPLTARAPQGLCQRCLGGRLLEADIEDFAPLELGAGRRFGDYQLIEEIARGGMGVIYRAQQLSLNRPVALKFVALMSASPDFLSRFEIEAEASASLSHPNIVPIYDFGEHGGQPFFSMRPLHESLDRKIALKPLDLHAAVDLLIKIARAAHFAHQRGIIHRDIKPSNILLDEFGEPFLADFGLAKLVERDSALTATRAMLGTPSYISPEQALGETSNITTAADVYSLGAVLYELIAAQPPFAGGTTLDTVRQVIEKDPRVPSSLNRLVDRDLDTICLHCLEKNPQRRYGSAEALADDLQRWRKLLPIEARPVKRWERLAKWARRHPSGALTIVVSVSALLAISIISTRARQTLARMAEERRAQLVRLNLSTADRLTEAGDISGALHWRLQALQLEKNKSELELQRIGMGTLLRAAPQVEAMFFHAAPVTYGAFSPDGRRIVTASDDGTARIWDAVTGKALTDPLIHGGAVYHADFSPDGKVIVTSADDGTAQIWNSSTGKRIGNALRCSATWYRRPMATGAVFRRDGLAIVTRSGDGAQLWDARTGDKIGEPFQHGGIVTQVSFSPDGRSLLTASTDHTAKIWDIANHVSPRITLSHEGSVEGAVFSPGGTRVATFQNWGGGGSIWNAATGERVALPLKHEKDLRLVQCIFSPDGSRVLTVGFDSTVRVWNAETGLRIWDTPIDVGISMAAFSPDGKRVVAAGFDLTARVLDAADGKLAWPILRHGALVFTASFDAAADRVLTTTENGVAQVWHWSHSYVDSFDHGSRIVDASMDSAGKRLTMAGVQGEAKVWDLQSGKLTRTVQHDKRVTQSLLSEDGESLATLSDDGLVRFWPPSVDGQAVGAVELTDKEAVKHIALNRNHSRLLAASDHGAVLWEPATGRRIGARLDPERRILFGGFSGDGKYFVTGAADGTAQVRETEGGTPIGRVIEQTGMISWAVFSPDAKRIVTASIDQSYSPLGASIWEVQTGRRLAGPLMHRDGVQLVDFSPDGRLVATAGEDAVVMVWDAATGRPVAPPIQQSSRVTTLAFSADSRMLATGNFQGIARVWSAESGQPVTPSLTHADRVLLARFLPEAKGLLTVSSDGMARIWSLARNEEGMAPLIERAQILSARRFDLEAGLIPLDRAALSNIWHRSRPE